MPHKGLSPDRVVAAAAELVDREGLPALTLSALAQSLDVRVPSLYKHINGLDDLHRRIAASASERLLAMLSAETDAHEGRDGLLAVAAAYRRFGTRHPGGYRAIDLVDDRVTADAVTALIDNVISSDVGSQPHAAQAIRAALHGFVLSERDGDVGEDPDAAFYALLALLDHGLASPMIEPSARRGGFRIPGLPVTLPRLGR